MLSSITISDAAPLSTNLLSLSGADAALFEIVNNAGADYLHLRAGTSLNYETNSSYSVTVIVDDIAIGTSFEDSETFTLNISNVNEYFNPLVGGMNSDTLLLRKDISGNVEFLSGGVVQAREPLASIMIININSGEGDDQLTIDFTNGSPFPDGGVNYNGENPAFSLGDQLILIGGSTSKISHQTMNADSGSVVFSGAISGKVNYTGLESIIDTVTAVERVFQFDGGAETITLSAAMNLSETTIDSSLSESITFSNPTGSLTINAGTGDDTISILSVDSGFNADLTVNGDAGNDTINVQGDINFSADKNLDLDLQNDAAPGDSDSLSIGSDANLILSGTGSAILKVSKNIEMANGSSVVTVDGNLTLEANQQATPTSFTIDGVNLNGSTLNTTGIGQLSVKGRGGTNGVNLVSGALIRGGTSGTTLIQGTGGNADEGSGVLWDSGGSIQTAGSHLQIIGVGGSPVNGFSKAYGVGSSSGGGTIAPKARGISPSKALAGKRLHSAQIRGL